MDRRVTVLLNTRNICLLTIGAIVARDGAIFSLSGGGLEAFIGGCVQGIGAVLCYAIGHQDALDQYAATKGGAK